MGKLGLWFSTSALTVALTVVSGVIAVASAEAGAGDLDPSFGTGGLVTTDFAGFTDEARAVVIQPDGKIVAAGFTGGPTGVAGFALTRYNPDGSLDTSFGSGGKVTTVLSGEFIFANAVALQPDGKIVAAGAVSIGGPFFGKDFALARYNPDGSLDTSFGTAGLVTTDFGGLFFETARAITLQPDGKVVAAGGVTGDFGLARYNPDGTLDTTFGVGGKVVTDFGFRPIQEGHAILLQPDGKLVAAGFVNTGPPPGTGADFALARYNPDGSLDTSFGSGGKVTTDFPSIVFVNSDVPRALLLQSDGRLVAVGFSSPQAGSTEGPNFALARYNPDGTLDTSFGVGGKVTTHLGGDDQANAAVLQPNGAVVAAGFTGVFGFPTTAKDFALARYNPDGTLDSTFGSGGIVTTDFGGNEDQANALVRQADGKIVAAGVFSSRPFGLESAFALARYLDTEVANVLIDIKPGSDPNSVNPRSKGVIPVAILTTEDFDATTVDPGLVRFGPGDATEKHGVGHVEDVDNDGDSDVVYHFATQDTGIQCGDTTATLTGATFGGQPVMGSDSIVTRGCK